MYDHGGLNRFYRLVWSEASKCFVPIPEVSKSRGKRAGGGVATAIAIFSFVGSVSHTALAGSAGLVGINGPSVVTLSAPSTDALPTGGHVVGGSATIHQEGNAQTIHQTTRSAAINWQTFNIGSENTVTFVQPDTTSIALNRVVGNQASGIYGVLKSNGRIFLVNPNGVLFAKGSEVSGAGILASTRDMSVEDFLAGRYRLAGAGNGSVINEGSLTASPGGFVTLIGAQVMNNGAISAHEGDVRLAAANEVTLRIDQGGLLEFTSTQGALDAMASNGGLIKADGGRIFLTAEALDQLTTATVNNTGVIEAHTVVNKNGKIVLMGDMDVGTTLVGGTLDASAPSGGDGGFVETSAAHVHISDTAKVTTRGATTGLWLIDPVDYTVAAAGGDMTGSALSTALGASNVTIQSTSGASGINGDVIISDSVTWSSNTLTLNAQGNIQFNHSVAASGTGALALEYGQATTDGLGASYVLADGVFIDLPAGQNFSTKKGSTGAVESYTVITELGLVGDQNATTLQGMKGDLTGRYVLGSDIAAVATLAWNPVGSENLGFDPVGSGAVDPNTQQMEVFTGKFDGLGHSISDLNISRSVRTHVGLFGIVAGATIQNVTLTNAQVQGSDHVGALVGTSGVDAQLIGSTFNNIHVSGTIEAENDGGGLIGWMDSASVTRATSTATVTHDSESSNGHQLGGIIGSAFETSIIGVSASGSISGRSNIGGVIGRLNGGSIVDALATGDILASENLGGGLAGSARGNFTDLSATGDVNGGGNLGGLFGSMDGPLQNGDATGSVSGDASVGGLIGYASGSVNDSTSSGAVTGAYFVGGLIGRNFASITNSASTSIVAGGERVGGLVGENYGSVSTSAATGAVDGDNWVGGLIGFNDAELTTVEASGAVVGGAYVGGLIGENKLGHVNFARATGTVTATGDIVGGLIGKNKLGFIENSSYSGLVSGGNHVGSLIGYNGGGVADSYSDSDVSGSTNVGGLVGENDGGITRSYATGDVSGQNNVGGLVGISYGNSEISVANATGQVTATANNAGGLIGRSEGRVLDSYATGDVTGEARLGGLAGYNSGYVTNVSADGDVNGNGDFVGGLVGENRGDVDTATATGSVTGANFVGGLIGDNYNLVTLGSASGIVSGGNAVGGLIGQSYGNVQTGSATGAVTGAEYVGGLVGDSYANIDNSTASGSVNGVYAVGGLAGYLNFAYNTITGSTAGGEVFASGASAGGLVGENYGSITGSSATGEVTGSDDVGGFVGSNFGAISSSEATGITTGGNKVGGFAGFNAGAINASTADGEVTGIEYIGGFVGYAEDPSFIEGSTATGDVHGEERVGGFAGINYSTITTSFAFGDVDGFYRVGGFAGRNTGSAVITNSVAHGAVVGTTSQIGGFVGRNDGTLDEVDARGAVDGTGADDVGGLVGSHRGSIIASVASGAVVGGNNVGGLVGRALYDTDDDNIPIPAVIAGSSASGAVSGGSAVGGLIGNNDLGHIIDSGSTSLVNASGDGIGGLIGVNTGVITNSTATGDVSGSTIVGGLIGEALDGTTVTLSSASGTAMGSGYVGGLIGILAATGVVDTSHATGAVTGGDQTGGFVGKTAGTISNSSATGTVGGVDDIGGFAGDNSGSLTDVWASGDVTSFGQGQYAAGGLIGYNTGTVTSVHASNNVTGDTLVGGLIGNNAGTVSHASATGSVIGTLAVGGFVGTNNGEISIASATGAVQGTTLVGGFLGNNNASVIDARAHGTVTGETNVGGFGGANATGGTLVKVYETGNVTVTGAATNVAAGGLVGVNDGTINVAYAIGNITGTGVSEQIGGLIGYHNGSVTDAYATGASSGANRVGGLIGEVDNAAANATNVYARGAVTSVGTARGALIGRSSAGTVTNGYWDMFSTNLVTAVGDNQGGSFTGVGLETAEAMQELSYVGFDFGENGQWKNYNEDTAPLLTAWLTSLTVDVSDNSLTYVYDGEGHQDVLSNLTYSDPHAASSGHIFGAARYDTGKNVGVYTDLTGLYSDQQGYNIHLINHGSLTITPKTITIGASATNKTYDGTTSVVTTLTPSGIIEGDSVSFTGVGNTVDRHAGSGKTVNVTSISGSGEDLANYSFADTAQTVVDIGKKMITLLAQGVSRAYNGTTLVDVTVTSDDVLNGDQVSFEGTGNTVDKHVGIAKNVSVSNITGTGAHSGNYDFAETTSASVDISKRAMGITALGIDRAYDGTTVVGVTLTSGDVVAGDNLVFSGVGSMTDKHAGQGKSVGVSSIIAAGTDLGNYDVAETATTTVNIAKRILQVNALGVTKTYDGTTQANVTLTPADLLDGDAISLTGTGTLANPHAGLDRVLNVTAIVGSGVDAGNYDYSAPLVTTTIVNKKDISLALQPPVVKRQDGSTSILLRNRHFSVNGVVAGDQLEIRDVNGSFADSTPGTGKQISVSLDNADLVGIGGTLASNYNVLETSITGDFGEIIATSSLAYEAALASVPTDLISAPGSTFLTTVFGPSGPAVSTGDADNGVSTSGSASFGGGMASVQTRENLLFRRTFSIADGGIRLPSGVTDDESAQ